MHVMLVEGMILGEIPAGKLIKIIAGIFRKIHSFQKHHGRLYAFAAGANPLFQKPIILKKTKKSFLKKNRPFPLKLIDINLINLMDERKKEN